VNEEFGGWYSNLEKSWLSAELRTANPTFTNKDWRDQFFENSLSAFRTSTFTFDANNQFFDMYEGTVVGISNGLLISSLSDVRKKQLITYTLGQRYECPPGKTLMKMTISFGWQPSLGAPFNSSVLSKVVFEGP
jgi:hypothetical protein